MENASIHAGEAIARPPFKVGRRERGFFSRLGDESDLYVLVYIKFVGRGVTDAAQVPVAEWSKARALGARLVRGAGSNPVRHTLIRFVPRFEWTRCE